MAVGRQEHLHAAFEVGVVEGFGRQVERVVVLRLVEGLPMALWSDCSASIWSYMPFWVLCIVSCRVFIDSMLDHRRHQCAQLGRGTSSLSSSGMRFVMSSDMVSMPSRLSNTDRTAQHTGMSKQCGFPVEVVAQRSEEVVEVGDVIAQVLNVGDRHVHLADHAVGSGVELTHEVVHLPHVVDAGLHVVAHFGVCRPCGSAGDWFIVWVVPCMPSMYGIVVCSIDCPAGA